MNYTFTTDVDLAPHALASYTDEFLAYLWHAAQFNSAPIEDDQAGWVTEQVGREIIRRWLASVPPSLWKHQGRDAVAEQLRRLRQGAGKVAAA